nr:cytochrome P450 2K1-like2 [Kryptolebias hermaphroditus]
MLEDIFQSPTSVSLFGVFVALLLLHLLHSSFSSQKRPEPPGPRPLPVFGNLFQLSKTYGPVFQVYFGPKKVVVLAGYRTVKEALLNQADEFGNREITPILNDLTQGHGILFSNGDSWKEMRRFALSTLKDFGMGRKMSEEIIIEECGYLIKEMEQYGGEAFNNTQAINYAASNVISALMFKKRFEYKDPVFQTMVEKDNETIRLTGSVSIMDFDEKSSHYHDENLLYSVMNLFAAGTDTTATTLKWGLLYMAKFPHIQDRVQEELSRVVGSRQIQTEDRKNLPYTDAVIHETQRFANIGPLAIPHKTTRNVTFQGYFIKKDTTVFPLLTSVLYDESEWESPHSFNPSHFLDDEGKFIRRDAFMPFSAGRRACLGESLAKMELFLFFTSLLQCFHFTPPPGVPEDELDLKPVVGMTLAPKPQQLCAVRRR